MRLTLAFIPLLAVHLPAQIAAGHVVVLTRAPAAQAQSTLLDVDRTTGVVRVLPRFLFDHLPPLAVAVDPVNGDVLVAVDDQGVSRLLRLQFVRGQLISVRIAATVTGAVTAIGFGSGLDLITTSVSSFSGAIHRHTRDAGSTSGTTLVTKINSVTAIETDTYGGDFATVVQSGSGQAMLSQIDLATGNLYRGPIVMPGLVGRKITGVHDLPTGAIRQAVTDDAGKLHLFEFMSTIRTIPTNPPLPAGALAATSSSGGTLVAVGGSAHPWLITMSVFGGGAGQWTAIAGPLPGDPVGLAEVPFGGAHVVRFGESCALGGGIVWSGHPRIGNTQFSVALGGAAVSTPALFVFGADDHFSGPVALPFRLNGCLLHVAPDVVISAMTSATGHARMSIPVPNQPSLVGAVVFAQWLVGQGRAWGASGAVSIWIGN